MNSWSRARKRIILAIVLFIALVLVGVPTYFLFHKTPTCSDGVMNGDEAGVDCGGSCQRLCAPESLPILLQGDPRVLTVATSTYEVVALFENPNQGGRIRAARYTISLYGEGSLTPVKVIEGSVYVPKGANFAVFEGPFKMTDTRPTRATLAWDAASLAWEKESGAAAELAVRNTLFSKLETAPRLEAMVGNRSLDEAANIDLTALVLDAQGNIIAASKTFIETLGPSEEKQAIFTWPAPFPATPVEIQILATELP